MTESQSSEQFRHLHKEGIILLANERLKFENMVSSVELKPLDDDLTITLKNIFDGMPRTGQIDPEEVFRKAISFLPALEAKRFLIDNFLEALKRGEYIWDTAKRYQNLGLLESFPPNTPQASSENLGKALEKRKSLLARVALTVIRIGINAIKSIPKWVEIEPQITLIGMVPMLTFTLKGEGMNIQELFDALSEGIEWGTKIRPNETM